MSALVTILVSLAVLLALVWWTRRVDRREAVSEAWLKDYWREGQRLRS
jgi:hypothetical protein